MEHPNPKERWKNMRRMAYTGIFTCLGITIAIIIEGKLSENLTTLLVFWGSIIGGYMGFSTARDGWGDK